MAITRAVLAALVLAGLTGCGGVSSEPAAGEQGPQVVVRAEPAQRRAMVATVYGLGRCEPLPRNIANLTTVVDGRVAEMPAHQGDAVKRGQVLVELDATIARAALAEKLAARDEAEAALRLLESLPRPEEQQSARLAIEEAKVAVAKAQALVDRLRPLRARDEVPESQMTEAELALKQASLQQQTAEAQWTTLMLKPRPQAVEEAKARIAAAEAAVTSARALVDLHSLRAPIDGVLDSLSCRLGQTLAVGDSVGQIVDCAKVDVVVWLPVPEVRSVRPGLPARIDPGGEHGEGSTTPQSGATAISGQVSFVGSVADPQTGNLPVRILVDNADRRLTVGEIAGATISIGQKKDALVVPTAAIDDLGEGPVLNVIRQGKSKTLRVKPGMRDRQWVEVLGTDLRAGEPVIVEGGYNLPEGTAITVRAAQKSGAASGEGQVGGGSR